MQMASLKHLTQKISRSKWKNNKSFSKGVRARLVLDVIVVTDSILWCCRPDQMFTAFQCISCRGSCQLQGRKETIAIVIHSDPKLRIMFKNYKTCLVFYIPCIRHGLSIFYHIFENHFFVFKEAFFKKCCPYVWLVVKSSL